MNHMFSSLLQNCHHWLMKLKARRLAKKASYYYYNESDKWYQVEKYLDDLHQSLKIIEEIKTKYPRSLIGTKLIAENILILKNKQKLPIEYINIAIQQAEEVIEEEREQVKINAYEAAIRRVDKEAIRKGLEEGIDVNRRFGLYKKDTTLLIVTKAGVPTVIRTTGAILRRHLGVEDEKVADCVRMLLENGASYEIRGNFTYTPLLYASMCLPKTVKVLLEYGASITFSNPFYNPLLKACLGISRENCLDNRVDYLFDNEGKGKDVEVVKILLGAGVDLNLNNLNELTSPILVALKRGRLATAKLLADKSGQSIHQIPKDEAIKVIKKIHPKPPKKEVDELLNFVNTYWSI